MVWAEGGRLWGEGCGFFFFFFCLCVVWFGIDRFCCGVGLLCYFTDLIPEKVLKNWNGMLQPTAAWDAVSRCPWCQRPCTGWFPASRAMKEACVQEALAGHHLPLLQMPVGGRDAGERRRLLYTLSFTFQHQQLGKIVETLMRSCCSWVLCIVS